MWKPQTTNSKRNLTSIYYSVRWLLCYYHDTGSWDSLEPVCCKKRQKKFMTSYWFGISRASKWYKIDPKWLRGYSCSFRFNLVSFRTFRCPLFPKPVTGHELFFAVSYSKPALAHHHKKSTFEINCFIFLYEPTTYSMYLAYPCCKIIAGCWEDALFPHRTVVSNEINQGYKNNF